ncbi:MAG: SAM-dependent chlorinase/fluorinase, partial [Chloroflexi bacterium]|nr:SAM-dependent chlorinase/fluorinase [Chloroflexota bacterium]
MARPIITLTTDFGVADVYVGAMKGVILGISPDAAIVDITHEVPPQDVRAGAYALDAAWDAFGPSTVHVAVVDPGVGTGRLPIAACGPGGTFVGPDNGLLSYLLAREGGPRPDAAPFVPASVALPSAWTAYHLTERAYWHEPVRSTFHGRDIFAPVAAHLSAGLAPSALGPRLTHVTAFAVPVAVEKDGRTEGCVQHVDRYGNLVTNIPEALLSAAGGGLTVDIGGREIAGLSGSFQGEAALVAVIGSGGWLEIAVPNGSAARELGVGIGDAVVVRLPS